MLQVSGGHLVHAVNQCEWGRGCSGRVRCEPTRPGPARDAPFLVWRSFKTSAGFNDELLVVTFSLQIQVAPRIGAALLDRLSDSLFNEPFIRLFGSLQGFRGGGLEILEV